MAAHAPSGISIDLAREIARQGEVRLTALTSLATAADLRATTFCGIFGATAVAVCAATLANAASDHRIWPLIAAGAFTFIGFFISALMVGVVAMPQDFRVGGGNPDKLREWSWDGSEWRSEAEMLDATVMRYGKSIRENCRVLEDGSRWVIAAFAIAMGSPLANVAAFFLTKYFV